MTVGREQRCLFAARARPHLDDHVAVVARVRRQQGLAQRRFEPGLFRLQPFELLVSNDYVFVFLVFKATDDFIRIEIAFCFLRIILARERFTFRAEHTQRSAIALVSGKQIHRHAHQSEGGAAHPARSHAAPSSQWHFHAERSAFRDLARRQP